MTGSGAPAQTAPFLTGTNMRIWFPNQETSIPDCGRAKSIPRRAEKVENRSSKVTVSPEKLATASLKNGDCEPIRLVELKIALWPFPWFHTTSQTSYRAVE